MSEFTLLLDVGNTRLKGGLWRSGQVHAVALPDWETHELASDLKALETQLDDPPGRIVVSCVRGAQALEELEQWSQARFDLPVDLARATANACGITNSYAQPDTMGVDRWMAMIGAQARASRAYCVADLGTATTLDAVDAAGRHLGGLIVPGASLMAHSITSKAPGVFIDDTARAVPWADNTQDAVYSGAAWSVADLVLGFRSRLRRHLDDESIPLYLCGGAAVDMLQLLADHSEIHHCPNLVLEGLGIWSDDNPQTA